MKTLIDKNQDAVYYEISWDATNNSGNKVGSRVYYFTVEVDKHHVVKKMILLKWDCTCSTERKS